MALHPSDPLSRYSCAEKLPRPLLRILVEHSQTHAYEHISLVGCRVRQAQRYPFADAPSIHVHLPIKPQHPLGCSSVHLSATPPLCVVHFVGPTSFLLLCSCDCLCLGLSSLSRGQSTIHTYSSSCRHHFWIHACCQWTCARSLCVKLFMPTASTFIRGFHCGYLWTSEFQNAVHSVKQSCDEESILLVHDVSCRISVELDDTYLSQILAHVTLSKGHNTCRIHLPGFCC